MYAEDRGRSLLQVLFIKSISSELIISIFSHLVHICHNLPSKIPMPLLLLVSNSKWKPNLHTRVQLQLVRMALSYFFSSIFSSNLLRCNLRVLRESKIWTRI